MDVTAFLAKPFVPWRIKHVNSEAPNLILRASAIPTLDKDINALQVALLPPNKCTCDDEAHEPVAITTGCEASAEQQPQKQQQQQQQLPPQQRKIKSVDEIVDVSDYFQTFEILLQLERQKGLELYRRYSQYSVTVNITIDDAKSNNAGNHQARVSFEAPGISDAKPPIYPGDTLLLRPLRKIAAWDHRRGWTDCVYSVQIQALVMSVTRSDRDTIAMTWIPGGKRSELALSYPESVYNICILPSSLVYDRCCVALKWASMLPREVSNQLLFPNEGATDTEILHDQTKLSMNHRIDALNPRQTRFVRLVIARTLRPSTGVLRSPVILTGPAGTGKTQALLHAIFEVLTLSSNSEANETIHRVLVCTSSHTAADVVTRRLAGSLNRTNLWRLLDSNRPVKTVPVSILPFTKQRADTGAFRLPETVELLQFKVIVCTCIDANILYRLGFTNPRLRIREQCILSHALATCHKFNVQINDVSKAPLAPHFTHLFIDEASQATEPEILIPFSVVVDHGSAGASIKSEIALVGDPRQLSPDVYSKEAADAGLSRSYMERLLQRPMNYLSGGWPFMLGLDDEQLHSSHVAPESSSIFLTINYRGHASFLMMPSALFYFDKLKVVGGRRCETDWIAKVRVVEAVSTPATALALQWNQIVNSNTASFVSSTPLVHSAAADGWTSSFTQGSGRIQVDSSSCGLLQFQRQDTWPIHFLGVLGQDAAVGMETFAGNNNSWCNRKEAKAVADIVVALTSSGVSSAAIGIMSAFRGQVVLIRKLLREVNLSGVNVGTIEDYQAVERSVIILSLTRASSKFVPSDIKDRAGVFHQVKRTNVALTRAEHLFIVVGNPHLMVLDPIWRQWLWFSLRNGLWYGEQLNHSWLDEMNSKPITIARSRNGETHSLLGQADDEVEASIIMSSLEIEWRTR